MTLRVGVTRRGQERRLRTGTPQRENRTNDPTFLPAHAQQHPGPRRSAKYKKNLMLGWWGLWPLNIARMLLLRGLKIDPPAE